MATARAGGDGTDDGQTRRQGFSLPLHVIHMPEATHRWVRWPALIAAGLAIEETATTPRDFSVEELARTGRIAPLAAWRILKHPVPVDHVVMTRRGEVACLLSHLRLMHAQIAAGDAVWATAEDDVAATEAMIRGLPLLVAAMNQLDPDWDYVSLAAWDSRTDHADGRSATIKVPGVGGVVLTRANFIAGTGAQLVSLKGARSIAAIAEHADTDIDRTIGFAARIGVLRVYKAQRRGLIQDIGATLWGREMYMPLGLESVGVGSIDHGQMMAGLGKPDGLDVVYDPMRFIPVWLLCVYVGTFLLACALAVVLVVVVQRRKRTAQH